MNKDVNCRIPGELKTRLEHQAAEEMASQASIIRKSLDEYCEENIQ
jgi:predicted DNA-binding protein